MSSVSSPAFNIIIVCQAYCEYLHRFKEEVWLCYWTVLSQIYCFHLQLNKEKLRAYKHQDICSVFYIDHFD